MSNAERQDFDTPLDLPDLKKTLAEHPYRLARMTAQKGAWEKQFTLLALEAPELMLNYLDETAKGVDKAAQVEYAAMLVEMSTTYQSSQAAGWLLDVIQAHAPKKKRDVCVAKMGANIIKVLMSKDEHEKAENLGVQTEPWKILDQLLGQYGLAKACPYHIAIDVGSGAVLEGFYRTILKQDRAWDARSTLRAGAGRILDRMLDHGVSLDWRDPGQSALSAALDNVDTDGHAAGMAMVDALLERGADWKSVRAMLEDGSKEAGALDQHPLVRAERLTTQTGVTQGGNETIGKRKGSKL